MDYADSKKVKKITWNAPKKADRPKSKPKPLKDLITATLTRHNIGRQVSSGMIVERLNSYLRTQNPDLAQKVRVVSLKFGKVKIGITHRIYQNQVKPYEEGFRTIIAEITDDAISFQYVLVIADNVI
jgi:hypothetical protein